MSPISITQVVVVKNLILKFSNQQVKLFGCLLKKNSKFHISWSTHFFFLKKKHSRPHQRKKVT